MHCSAVMLVRVEDVPPNGYTMDRATVRQKKTGRPAKFELTDQTRQRLSTELRHSAAKARTCPAIPLSSCGPRSFSSNSLPMSWRVTSETIAVFGSAIPCSRAARFGVSPIMPRSCASPEPIKSPTTTRPVAMPTRVCRGVGDFNAPTAAISSSAALTARCASSSCACG